MQTVIILTLFVATACAASTGYTYTPPDKSFAASVIKTTIEPVKTVHTHTSTKTSKNSELIESSGYKKESGLVGASGHLPKSSTTTETIVNKVAFKPLKTVETNTIPIGADVVFKSTGFSANSNIATVERKLLGAAGAKTAETVVENVVVEPAETVRTSSVVTGAGKSVGATGILAAPKVNTGTVFNAGGTVLKTSKGTADNGVSKIISKPVVSAGGLVSSAGLVRPEEHTNAESTVHSSTEGKSGVVSPVLDIPIVSTSKLISTGNSALKTSGGTAGVIPKIVSAPIVSTGGLITTGSTVVKTSGGSAGVIPKIVSTPTVSTGGLITSESTVRKTSVGNAGVIPKIVSAPIVSTAGLINSGTTVLKASSGSASVIPKIVSTPIVSTGGLITSGTTVLKASGVGSVVTIPKIVSTPIVSTGGLVNSGSLVRSGGLTNLGNPVLQTTGGNYGVGAEFLRTPLVSTGGLVSSGNTVLQSNGLNSGAAVNRVLQVDANALLNSVPQTVEYNKQFFHFSAPEEDESESITTQQLSNILKKNLQVVFITAPENNAATNAALQIAKQAIEQKTSIYVLSKQNEASQVVAQLEQVQENVPTLPEVKVIKYRTPQDAAHAIDEIQSQYNHFGGTSEVVNGGVAPVLNYASPAKTTYTGGNVLTGGSRLSEVNKVVAGIVPVGDTYLPVPL